MRVIPITPFAVAALLGCWWLAACGTVPGAALLPGALSAADEVEVSEIRRLPQCAAASDAVAVELIADADALRDWQQARGVDLIGAAALPAGPFAVIDHGNRTRDGNGLAVSRRAVQRGQTLKLTASFLSPKPDEPGSDAPSSPCVLVKLPAGRYDRIEVVDPAGRRRAVTATVTAAPPR